MKTVKLAELNPAPYNPNYMDKTQTKQLSQSIDTWGYLDPIIVNKRNMVVVGGHQRLTKLLQKGIIEEDVVLVDLDTNNEKALNLALNKIKGQFDETKLQTLIEDLELEGFDVELTGFQNSELESLFPEEKLPVIEDEYDPEEVEVEAKVQVGDIWILGRHRLLCGDSTNLDDIKKLMNGQLVDMVFTDPPYGVDYSGGAMHPRKKLEGDESTDLYMPCCKMAAKFSTNEAPLYLWHAGVKASAAANAAIAAGYKIRCEIIWNKNQAQYGALGAQYKQKHEPCYYCYKEGKTVNWTGPTNEITVWDIERSQKNEYHPTQKPIALAARAISNHNVKKVLDLFGGSGSTLMACEQLKKECYTIELDPHYCDVIINRWEEFTGQKAQIQ